MKISVHRWCTATLISLSLLLGFAVPAGAQGPIFNPPSHSPKLREKTGKAHKTPSPEPPSGYTEEVLYSFCSATNCTDGQYPEAGLIQDAAGNLYGTTIGGGSAPHGGGTVYKVDITGHETVLYSFCSATNCTDGSNPFAGLIQDAAGNLYGTTSDSGANGGDAGTVFKLDTTGHETVLYSFCSLNCADGENPVAGVIQDAAGNLYGTTSGGGVGPDCLASGGCGTLFKVDTTGRETVLYSFCSVANCTDGKLPFAGLVEDAAGNFYSTTPEGGATGYGTLFKLDTTGQETVLYSFCAAANCTDGATPEKNGLVLDAAGNLYGTTAGGGTGSGTGCQASRCGTVFKVDNTGHETVLYSFCSAPNCADGVNPQAGLVQDAAGNLYGTTSAGGANKEGTVFKLDTTGHETVLYSFCSVGGANCTDGANPEAGVILDAAGNVYGTTSGGGTGNYAGTVFKLTATGGTATVTLTSTPNPSFVNQSVTFTAVVSGSGATPTGSVTFEEGTTSLGTGTLSAGKASLTTAFSSAGSFSIVANYSGDGNYNAASSAPLTQVVDLYTTTTALSSSLNPSTYGQSVTFTATVSSAGTTPTGTVTFKNGTKSLGSATLSSGVAKLVTSTLAAGTSSITATYGGDTAHAGSTSPTLKQVVKKATSKTTVASSLNPSKVGQKVTFTATVTSTTTTPTGTVTFKDGSKVLGTGPWQRARRATARPPWPRALIASRRYMPGQLTSVAARRRC